jgi:hypothetical protein
LLYPEPRLLARDVRVLEDPRRSRARVGLKRRSRRRLVAIAQHEELAAFPEHGLALDRVTVPVPGREREPPELANVLVLVLGEPGDASRGLVVSVGRRRLRAVLYKRKSGWS